MEIRYVSNDSRRMAFLEESVRRLEENYRLDASGIVYVEPLSTGIWMYPGENDSIREVSPRTQEYDAKLFRASPKHVILDIDGVKVTVDFGPKPA